MFITDPWFYLAAVPAILVAGVAKGGFGGGLVVMSVPILALVVSPDVAAAIMLPQLCLMDLIGLPVYRKSWDRNLLRVLLPAGVLGILIGTLGFQYMKPAWIRLMIGGLAIGFCLFYWFGKAPTQAQGKGDRLKATFWGAMAGFTSFVAHAGGPPLSIYLLPRRMDKTLLVGTMIFFFATANYIKLVPYSYLGLFHDGGLATSLLLSPLAFIGMGLGVFLHHRVNEARFYRTCYIFLFLTGLKLVYDGIS